MPSAADGSTMACDLALSCFFVLSSFRRSDFVPTRRMGTPGAWCWISGTHFVLTFSKEELEMTEKQTRNTSVWG